MENNTTNNIQKPISMIIKESKDIIVNAMNSVSLHPTLLEMIMKELYLEIQNQVKVTFERERYEYEKMLSEYVLKENGLYYVESTPIGMFVENDEATDVYNVYNELSSHSVSDCVDPFEL